MQRWGPGAVRPRRSTACQARGWRRGVVGRKNEGGAVTSKGMGGLAALLIIGGLTAAPLQAQGLAGASSTTSADDGSAFVTGRKQPLYPKSPEKGDAIEIEPGHAVAGDFADAPPLYGKRHPVMVYRVQGQEGKALTAKVDSTDVHVWLWFSRELNNLWTGPTMAPMPVAGGPKSNFLTLNPQRTGPYYIMVVGVPTKENGKLTFGRYADSGRFTLAVTDADHPEAKPVGGAVLLTGGPVKPAGLAQTYAQLCANVTSANADTCRVLREGLAAKIAADSTSSAKALSGPLGIRVIGGGGAQVRAEVVAVDPGGPAAAAGLQPGDALLYAEGAGGQRVFFGDQASLDQWALKQAPDSSHQVAFARGAELMTAKLQIRPAAARLPARQSAKKKR